MSRQQNVQQQNAEVERRIRSEAKHWRERGVPAALREVGELHGVDWSTCIVVDLEIDFPGMPRLFGLLVTANERFIRFEVDTDEKHQTVESVEQWVDITEQQNCSVRNRGTGAGFGALAVKVLREFGGGA